MPHDAVDPVRVILRMPRGPEVVRYLAEHPGSAREAILRDTGIPPGTLSRVLHRLETAVIITGDHPGGPNGRQGYPQHYTVNTTTITTALHALPTVLLGTTAP